MDAHETAIGDAMDREGRSVVLLERVWSEKILRTHPEMVGFLKAVTEVVAAPDHVERDSRPDRERCFAKDRGPTVWLLVVVSYEQVPARTITAYGYRKDPPLWKVST